MLCFNVKKICTCTVSNLYGLCDLIINKEILFSMFRVNSSITTPALDTKQNGDKRNESSMATKVGLSVPFALILMVVATVTAWFIYSRKKSTLKGSIL